MGTDQKSLPHPCPSVSIRGKNSSRKCTTSNYCVTEIPARPTATQEIQLPCLPPAQACRRLCGMLFFSLLKAPERTGALQNASRHSPVVGQRASVLECPESFRS